MESLSDLKLIEIIIAAIVAYIAWQQWRTQERTRKQDLFDKRWEYYRRSKEGFLNELSSTLKGAKKDEIDKHIDNYITSYADEAFFLFGADIEEHVRKDVSKILQKSGSAEMLQDPVTSFRKPFEKYLQVGP